MFSATNLFYYLIYLNFYKSSSKSIPDTYQSLDNLNKFSKNDCGRNTLIYIQNEWNIEHFDWLMRSNASTKHFLS